MKEIEKIIAKYLEGESSLEEEKQLREYLKKDTVPKEYLYLKDEFSYFEFVSNEKCNINTDELLKSQKRQAKVYKLSEMQRFAIKVSSAAATLIIVIAAYFIFVVDNDKYPNDTIKDPQIAYKEAQHAFGLVSEKLNKGTNKLSKFNVLQTSFKKAEKISEFNENLKKAAKIDEFNRIKNKYVSHVFGV
jgi:hypothetical protein